MAMPYRTLAGWPPERQAAILAEADAFLDQIDEKHQPTGIGR
jgi:hypothetical protein